MKMVNVYDESTNKVVGSVTKYDEKEIAEMVDRAYAMQPAILDNASRDIDIASDMEVFGLIIPIILFDTDEEAVEIAQ
ncbi:MAG: aldehyde dehydrogenase family protein [Clostridiales bacterium]|nr:aldehyde dehydrogenase family protein [Clostridiales bacterium]